MTKALLIDPFSGASGDMLLAALVDAGCPLAQLREQLLAVPALAGVTIDAENVGRGAIRRDRRALCGIEGGHDHLHQESRVRGFAVRDPRERHCAGADPDGDGRRDVRRPR